MVEDLKKIKRELSTLKKKKSKKKGIFKGKQLKKPETKLKKIDPKKFITRGLSEGKLVREGKTGWFNEETIGESKWL